MKKSLPLLLCLLTLSLLLVIDLQERCHLIPLKPLNGVQVETPFPAVTMADFGSGKMQHQLEQYSKDHFGFREPLIRTYNQYLWDCYHQTNVESILVGKQHYLYNTDFVDDYQGLHWKNYAPDLQTMRYNLFKEASRLKKLQDLLAEYGKTLFVMLEPGKTRVYPEYLPDRIIEPEGNYTAADLYPTYFDSLGVNYINIDRWFQQAKDTATYPLYPQLGTHWSNLAALHVTDSLLRYMEQLGNMNLPELAVSNTLYDTTMTPDDDLEKLLNLARPVRGIANQYAHFTVESDSNTVMPSWLVVGDSYFWNISYHIPLDQLFKQHHFWYYNSSVFYDPEHSNTGQIDWLDELMNSDFVTVSYCTANLYAMSNHFSSKALATLCCNHEEIHQALQNIMASMRNTPEWIEALQAKADAQGQTLETVMYQDAEYMLYANAEEYLPALKEARPVTRNTMLRYYDPDDPVGAILRNMHNDPQWMEGLKAKANEKQLDLETVMIQDAEWILQQP